MSVFRLKSDLRFFEKKGNGIKLIKFGQNRDKFSRISKDRLSSGKGFAIPSLNTVALHQIKFRLSSDYQNCHLSVQ